MKYSYQHRTVNTYPPEIKCRSLKKTKYKRKHSLKFLFSYEKFTYFLCSAPYHIFAYFNINVICFTIIFFKIDAPRFTMFWVGVIEWLWLQILQWDRFQTSSPYVLTLWLWANCFHVSALVFLPVQWKLCYLF